MYADMNTAWQQAVSVCVDFDRPLSIPVHQQHSRALMDLSLIALRPYFPSVL
jgi:hypothetical protein